LLITLKFAEVEGFAIAYLPDVHLGRGPRLSVTFGRHRGQGNYSVALGEDLLCGDAQSAAGELLAPAEEIEDSVVAFVVT
jgi:hypothetical protein